MAGHIPGARNVPSTAVLDDAGTFLRTADLARIFESHGATVAPGVGVYCGSGVTAAVTIAALRAAGVEAELFPGSWSQWSSDPTRAVATGH